MNHRKNILYIFHVSNIGGGSYCLLNMVKKLDREFFNPIILLKNEGPLCDELKKLGAIVIIENSISTVPYNKSIFNILSIKQIYLILISLKKVKYWIKKTDADIIHINTMMMYPYAIHAHTLGRKVVVHVREHWPKGKHQIQFKIAKKLIQLYSDKIIAINATSAEMIGILPKTQVIYDWIDFENRDESIDLRKIFGDDFKNLKIFLFLGGIHNIKGSLEIFEVIYNDISYKDIRLLVVGCQNKLIIYKRLRRIKKLILRFFNYYSYLEKAKSIAQKEERIVFIPSTYQVKSLIEQSFCVVSFFTIPHANLPLAEAIWLGKPSIAANTPEANEYSDGGKAALLFTMKDKDDFKNKILFALENEALINENAINGMSNIQEKFDPIRNSELLNKIYKKLVS
ncbi:MAG TPA: glycosyltransferase family 4 protein [Prolixibacteraceae bacterium]|nr:glycosyltransferase family 4 protein [Prolixibacteraceae bacterium]